jgi:CelD/BcsL family acetyltransferase involved in cellulose biosynthesis
LRECDWLDSYRLLLMSCAMNSSATLQIRAVPVEDFAALSFPDSGFRHPMASAKWARLSYANRWWPGEPLILEITFDEQRLLLPLRVEPLDGAAGLSLIRFYGHGLIDVMEGLYSEAWRLTPEMLLQLLAELKESYGAFVLDLAGLIAESPLLAGFILLRDYAQSLTTEVLCSASMVCLVSETAQGEEHLFRKFGSTLRKKLRRAERNGYRLTLPEGLEDRERSVQSLLRYHAMRWGDEMSRTEYRALESFILSLANDSSISFPTLSASDGRAVSVLMVLEGDETNYLYLQGFDPAFSHISPSRCVIAFYLEHLAKSGKLRLDFLRGDEPYKREFCDAAYDLMRVTVGVGKQVTPTLLREVHKSFV